MKAWIRSAVVDGKASFSTADLNALLANAILLSLSSRDAFLCFPEWRWVRSFNSSIGFGAVVEVKILRQTCLIVFDLGTVSKSIIAESCATVRS